MSGRSRLALTLLFTLVAGTLLVCVGWCIGIPCVSTGLRQGVWLEECPDSDLRLSASLSASGLVRGDEGQVRVAPEVRYWQGQGAQAQLRTRPLRRGYQLDLELLDADDQPMEGLQVEDWNRGYRASSTTVTLPQVPDGDYTLRATVSTRFETVEVRLPLPLYTPALAHVLTDRPLYRPGQEVLLRSLLVRRTDLAPLEGRPGRWRIRAPDGTVMLEERGRSGPYGVADTSFPLDRHAPRGTWTATWQSGSDEDAVTFDVRPFQLPRMQVELQPDRSWYPIGQGIRIRGTARYSSGAPVAQAPVELRLSRAEGRWPMPLSWEEPIEARTDAHGRFEVRLDEVPADLVDRAVLRAVATVTESAGERATGQARLVLSEHDLQVEAVTELADGLVGGFNNRVWLRVATPDGTPQPGATVRVSPWWNPEAEPYEAVADEDGVASLQIDPGDPSSVVIEPAPVRVRPRTPEVATLRDVRDLDGPAVNIATRRALDALVPAITACADQAPDASEVAVGLQVDGSGAVRRVMHGSAPHEQCVGQAMRRLRLSPGRARTLSLRWRVPASERPGLRVRTDAGFGSASAAQAALTAAALRARSCLAPGRGNNGAAPFRLHWAHEAEARRVEIGAIETLSSAGLSGAELACLRQALAQVPLADPARSAAMGTARLSLEVRGDPSQSAPRPTTFAGYQLRVAAAHDGQRVGEAPLVLREGSVPPLRIRATPALAHAGDTITFDLLRGPRFRGALPEELRVMQGSVKRGEIEVDPESRSARFEVPEGVEGFLQVDHAGARAVVYVAPRERLQVAVSMDKAAYRPGELATLSLQTRAGERPVPAGVGLVGVDTMLASLAPLPGPDAYGRVTVRAKAESPAFGAFEPAALVLGRIRGAEAARAAILRISQLPTDAAGDQRIGGDALSADDDEEVLVRAFHRALDATLGKVREWEAASEDEVLTARRMADFWQAGLADLRREGRPATDAYGRELSLGLLSADLLGQVDPRRAVRDATRLPEDVEPWAEFVRREVR